MIIRSTSVLLCFGFFVSLSFVLFISLKMRCYRCYTLNKQIKRKALERLNFCDASDLAYHYVNYRYPPWTINVQYYSWSDVKSFILLRDNYVVCPFCHHYGKTIGFLFHLIKQVVMSLGLHPCIFKNKGV